MGYRPFLVNLASSLSVTVISPEGERVGFTLPRWIKLNIVKESTPIESAASSTVNWLDADAIVLPMDG